MSTRSYQLAGFENGELRSLTTRILKEVDPVGRLVRATHEKVEVTVTIIVKSHGIGPQPDTEVHHQTGMIVLHPFQRCGGLGSTRKRPDRAGNNESCSAVR